MAAPDLVKNLLHDLAAGVGSAVESRTASVVTKVVEAPEFASAFESATRTAHADLVATLEGENTGTVVTEGDTVSIKLATVGNAVRAQLVAAGFTFVDRIPPLEASVPITTVEQLETWQGYYQVLTVLVWLGPLLVLGFAAAGAWLVRDLAMAGAWFTGAALVALVVVVAGVRAAVTSAPKGCPTRSPPTPRGPWWRRSATRSCATRRSSASCSPSGLAVAAWFLVQRRRAPLVPDEVPA